MVEGGRELAQDSQAANWDSMVMLGWTDWKMEGVRQGNQTRQQLSELNENMRLRDASDEEWGFCLYSVSTCPLTWIQMFGFHQ